MLLSLCPRQEPGFDSFDLTLWKRHTENLRTEKAHRRGVFSELREAGGPIDTIGNDAAQLVVSVDDATIATRITRRCYCCYYCFYCHSTGTFLRRLLAPPVRDRLGTAVLLSLR